MLRIISDIFLVKIKFKSFRNSLPRGLHRALKLAAVPASDAIGDSPWLQRRYIDLLGLTLNGLHYLNRFLLLLFVKSANHDARVTL